MMGTKAICVEGSRRPRFPRGRVGSRGFYGGGTMLLLRAFIIAVAVLLTSTLFAATLTVNQNSGAEPVDFKEFPQI